MRIKYKAIYSGWEYHEQTGQRVLVLNSVFNTFTQKLECSKANVRYNNRMGDAAFFHQAEIVFEGNLRYNKSIKGYEILYPTNIQRVVPRERKIKVIKGVK